MKILAVHGFAQERTDKAKMVDWWRVYKPIQELKKHVDWEIVEEPTLIKEIEKYQTLEDFSEDEMEKACAELGKYDVIWLTYFSNPTFYALLKVVQARYKTKFILDVDDDIFAIKLDNPIWLKLTDENVYHIQCMIRDADFLTTSTESLATILRERREQAPETVFVVPNRISNDYKQMTPNNGDKVIIGYFGGSSHIGDVDNTCMIEAVEKIMHEYKNVHFVTCGIPVEKYVPKGRYTYLEGGQGHKWVREVFPNLNFDISLGPLEECIFANGKSNIKWQESTRMGAAFVASSVGPYKTLKNGVNSLLVNNNTEEWYTALKKLVDRPKLRNLLVENAKNDIRMETLEIKGHLLKNVFETVHKS